MATDDESDGPVTSEATPILDEKPVTDPEDKTAPEPKAEAKRSAAAPVRVAPLRRRGKAKSSSSKPGKASAENAADGDEADKPVELEKSLVGPGKGTAKRAKSGSSFVTVDRVDPRTTLLWLGAAAVAVILIAASVLFAVGGYRLEQQRDLRAEYDAFAQQVTVNLTSLNKSNVDDIRKTLLDKTSGTAYENLQMVTQQIISQIEQHGIQTQGRVLSSAVTEAKPEYGKVLMVLGWTQRIGNNADQVESQVFRWRVEMRRINGVLKLTKFDWVY